MMTTMINRIIIISIMLATLCSLVLWLTTHKNGPSAAPFMGALWNAANLFMISILAHALIIDKKYNYALLISLVKFPLLYGAGYLLLTSSLWNPWHVAAGLPLIFVGALIAPWVEFSKEAR